MLELYKNIFKQLNNDVPYAVWKAVHVLDLAVHGEGDIDILVSSESQGRFEEIVKEHGFFRAEYKILHFPYVEHWYGYDDHTGKLCHLHVYYNIVTGESHLKAYHIPFEDDILLNRTLNSFNIYEASPEDQALLYTMRHYMKRSSLLGFLLWAYEKGDYLQEYEYIKNQLAGLDKTQFLSKLSPVRTDFDFHSLDLHANLSGFLSARKMRSSISGYRRYSPLVAAVKSVLNMGIRVYMKVCKVKKNLHKGPVLAVSGIDGSGKTSMVEELRTWLGKSFSVQVLHLGKPTTTILTFPLRPALFLYRSIARGKTHEDNGTNTPPTTPLKKKSGLIWCMRYLALAYERYRLAKKARRLADKGIIVICDRYPSLTPGKMDSPRIEGSGTGIVGMMQQIELRLYERLPKADGLIFLNVSIEEAIKRNRNRNKIDKETDEGIVQRHTENQGLDYCAEQVIVVDGNRDYESVLSELKSVTWGLVQEIERQG